MKIPTWRNTLNYNYKYWGHISKFWETLVVPSGYPFFLWNDRIYEVNSDRTNYNDTNLTIHDL